MDERIRIGGGNVSEQNWIELRNITKDFSGVRALDKVSIKILPGRVHTLVGENGAGKSTLMKILNGLYKPNEGTILIGGEEAVIHSPIDARKKGIAMIYQELNYISELSLEENIFMGRFPSGKIKGTVDWKQVRKDTLALFAQEGLNYDPAMKIKHLSVSEIQMLEILKAISCDAKVIIMDEPTSSITTREVETLFEHIQQLKQRGIAIVYISHKMEEVFRISDDITVLRDGKVVDSGPAGQFDIHSLIAKMVGRELKEIYPKVQAEAGKTVLELKHLSSSGVFKDIDLTIRQGEILGLAGLVGAGRTELARAIAGLDGFTSGEIYLEGERITPGNVRDAMQKGIVMVSEDRREYGIIGCRDILENATLADNAVSRGLLANRRPQVERAKNNIRRMKVKAPSLDILIENLSGGNQQKVVLAKWLMLNAKVLILDEPTRGIDVGAKYEIYKIICELAQQGYAILMISSEIPELMGMADRIQVMCRGRISPEIQRDAFSQELIMQYAVGGIL